MDDKQKALFLKHREDRLFLRYGLGFGILSGLLWALNNLWFARGYGHIDFTVFTGFTRPELVFIVPLVCAAINDMVAAISLVLYNLKRRMCVEILRSLNTRPGKIICLAALLGGPVGQFCYALGIVLAGPAYAIIMIALYPIIGCLLSYFCLNQPISRRMWVGICFSVAGAVLAGADVPVAQGDYFIWGIAFSFLAAVCWGVEIVLAIFGMSLIDPHVAISIREIVSGTVLCFLVVPLVYGLGIMGQILQNPVVTKYLVLAGVAAGFSYMFWYKANNMVGCARGTATNTTFVVWGAMIGLLVYGPGFMTWQLLAGCLLVLFGVVLVSVDPSRFLKEGYDI